MKLFFDQNISYRIVKKVNEIFPESIHCSTAGLNGKPDLLLRKFCKENNFTIITFDSDFYEMANLYGHPPKIIWIRSGNKTTNEISNLLHKYESQIKDFIIDKESPNLACLEINA